MAKLVFSAMHAHGVHFLLKSAAAEVPSRNGLPDVGKRAKTADLEDFLGALSSYTDSSEQEAIGLVNYIAVAGETLDGVEQTLSQSLGRSRHAQVQAF